MKVYLKFNKTDTVGYMCLMSWMEIFRDHDIVLLCDLFDAKKAPPKILKEILKGANKRVKIMNTNYVLSEKFDPLIPDIRYRKAAAANLTCFKHNKDPFFWMVDADDTMFLTRKLSEVTSRLIQAEEMIVRENYDSLALDFYRMHNDTWSFGVCLVKRSLDFDVIRSKLSEGDFGNKDTRCLDICFDKLRRKNELSLRSFVLPGVSFMHYVHKSRNLPYTIYEWSDTQMNGQNMPADFIKL